jgi:hypothetical protein
MNPNGIGRFIDFAKAQDFYPPRVTYSSSDGTSFLAYIRNKINPFNWFSTQAQIDNQFNNFMERQYNVAHADMSLYPYTVNNPYLPWYKKLSFAMFGESQADEIVRIKHLDFAFRDYDKIRVGVHTPSVASVGLGTLLALSINSMKYMDITIVITIVI